MTCRGGNEPDCTGPVSEDEMHECPYAAEINEDTETLCACCSSCTGECAMDI